MSVVQRILDSTDTTFAPRDALAMLAYVFDMRGVSGAEFAGLAAELGLATSVPYDPELHPELSGCLPGDTVTTYTPEFLAAIGLGRERLAARWPTRPN